jgi:quercetin dioxygenase-like cupin family protein
LKWHRDRENRLVEVLEGEDWYLQMDDEFPKKLVVGEKYYIPEGVYHRVIKGNQELKVLITFV